MKKFGFLLSQGTFLLSKGTFLLSISLFWLVLSVLSDGINTLLMLERLLRLGGRLMEVDHAARKRQTENA